MSSTVRRLATLSVITAFFASIAATPAYSIYRGYDAPFSSYRFMVSIRTADLPDRHICGGTLIASDIILTAAHCVTGVGTEAGIVAVVGTNTSGWPSAKRVPVVGSRVPEDYNLAVDNRSDVAVLRLATAQSSPTVQLAAKEPPAGTRLTTAGWGCTDRPPNCRTFPDRLKAADQIVLNDWACNRAIMWKPPANAPTSICTWAPASSVNHGDSGGPLLRPDGRGGFTQVGVTSLGSDNTAILLGSFTSVPVESTWITRAIESLRNSDRVLVFGSGDYGNPEPRDNLAGILTDDGYKVDVASALPADLSPYRSVYYVSTEPLADNDVNALVGHVQSGRSLYLTGERPCCEPLNAADTAIVNRLIVSVGGITIGGQGDPFYATGSVKINSQVVGQAAVRPTVVTDWTVSAPGGMSNVFDDNVFASVTSNGTTIPVAALWDSSDVIGAGRLAVFMDINWLETSYWNSETAGHIARNIALFLSGAPTPPQATVSPKLAVADAKAPTPESRTAAGR
jgi:secreted trypsin-like serine protease